MWPAVYANFTNAIFTTPWASMVFNYLQYNTSYRPLPTLSTYNEPATLLCQLVPLPSTVLPCYVIVIVVLISTLVCVFIVVVTLLHNEPPC